MEIRCGKDQYLWFDEIETDGTMDMAMENQNDTISKGDAEKIVKHLTKVFKLEGNP